MMWTFESISQVGFLAHISVLRYMCLAHYDYALEQMPVVQQRHNEDLACSTRLAKNKNVWHILLKEAITLFTEAKTKKIFPQTKTIPQTKQ